MRLNRRVWPMPLLQGCALLVLTAMLCGVAAAQDLQPIPPLQARVTDLTGTLSPQQRSAIEQKLAAFEANKGAQLAVLMVPTTRPEEIEQYSIRVVEQWRLGREEVDDGALLIVAKDDRRVRIEVGYGLEGALTDATSRRIIDEIVVPLFRQGDYYGGINAGIDQMIRVIDGEPLPPPDRRWRGESPGVIGLLPFLLMMALMVSFALRAIFGRMLGSAFTGGLTGGVIWLLSGLVGVGILVGALAFFFSLFSGFSAGRSRWSSYPRHGGWGGGWGGGIGGGGFGGGGFGGLGGGFGGGGASGRW